MSNFSFVLNQIWSGNSVTRAMLNLRLRKDCFKGNTIDVGGGKSEDYISFMNRTKDVNFTNFDIKTGAVIDFEKDPLPAQDSTYDTVIFLNVMEHIFNYQHIANEVVRITKSGGQVIGFVPFLMWYHPDHSDYFRYTHEAIEKIFKLSGAENIKIEAIGAGPFIAAAQMILLSFPRILRVPVFIFFKSIDTIYTLLKGDKARTYELGYYFNINK